MGRGRWGRQQHLAARTAHSGARRRGRPVLLPSTYQPATPLLFRDPHAAHPTSAASHAVTEAPPLVRGALAILEDAAPQPGPHPAITRRRILVVEDDPRTANVLRTALELEGEAGWEVEVAPEGLRALELAACAPPDLVLLDVRLPGIDGAEVYRRLRANHAASHTHVLFLSAGTSLDLYLRGIEDGVLLRKPFDVVDLIALVRALLAA